MQGVCLVSALSVIEAKCRVLSDANHHLLALTATIAHHSRQLHAICWQRDSRKHLRTAPAHDSCSMATRQNGRRHNSAIHH